MTGAHDTKKTSLAAFDELREDDDDVSLRRVAAAEIATEPATTAELAERFEDTTQNSIRPRVNELVRMGCVNRDGTRTTDSGNDAYVHHITDKGRDYLNGDADPDPMPPLSRVQSKVVKIARQVVYGSADEKILESAVLKHDSLKRRRDPNWSPPEVEAAYLADEIPDHIEPKDNSDESAASPTEPRATDEDVTDTDEDTDEDTTPAGPVECAGCDRKVPVEEAYSIKFIDGTVDHLCPACHDEFNQEGM